MYDSYFAIKRDVEDVYPIPDANTYSGEDKDDLVAKGDGGIKIKFMDWYYDTCEIEEQDFWDSFKDAIKYHILDCVVTGELGLWDGKHKIVPTCMELMDAINKCLKHAEDYIISVNGEYW